MVHVILDNMTWERDKTMHDGELRDVVVHEALPYRCQIDQEVAEFRQRLHRYRTV